ncbi:hypothetical protein NL676_004155 [Syzygium grande]|nr:hypothetical protein NL676_004155 [Syzygium grande]
MHYLSNLMGKRVVPVGPLVQDPGQEDGDDNIIKWLDKKEKCSSVFVWCGIEYYLIEKEREEIAYGLELSNVNIIWVIRFPVGESMELEEALLAGFLERVGDRGLLLNAHIIEVVGIGLEVNRNKSGELVKEEIAKVIKGVVVERDGGSVRKKAKEMRDSIRKKKGEIELDEVVDALIDVLRDA